MTGLARHGLSIRLARTGIEVLVLVAGVLLGGSIGVGTAVFAFGIGPLVQIFLPRLAMHEAPDRHLPSSPPSRSVSPDGRDRPGGSRFQRSRAVAGDP